MNCHYEGRHRSYLTYLLTSKMTIRVIWINPQKAFLSSSGCLECFSQCSFRLCLIKPSSAAPGVPGYWAFSTLLLQHCELWSNDLESICPSGTIGLKVISLFTQTKMVFLMKNDWFRKTSMGLSPGVGKVFHQ